MSEHKVSSVSTSESLPVSPLPTLSLALASLQTVDLVLSIQSYFEKLENSQLALERENVQLKNSLTIIKSQNHSLLNKLQLYKHQYANELAMRSKAEEELEILRKRNREGSLSHILVNEQYPASLLLQKAHDLLEALNKHSKTLKWFHKNVGSTEQFLADIQQNHLEEPLMGLFELSVSVLAGKAHHTRKTSPAQRNEDVIRNLASQNLQLVQLNQKIYNEMLRRPEGTGSNRVSPARASLCDFQRRSPEALVFQPTV